MEKPDKRPLKQPKIAFGRLLRMVALVLGVLWACFSAAQEPQSGACTAAEGKAAEVSSVRGLEFKRSIDCLVKNEREIEEYLRELIAKQIPAERLKAEEALYRSLGLIPEDFDYERGLIKLYISQLGGYYDPEKKIFVISARLPPGQLEGIITHELVHALQDQHISLKDFVDPRIENGDLLLARLALTEGEALAVSADYFAEKNGRSQAKSLPRGRSEQQGSAPQSWGAFDPSVPFGLKLLASFPYLYGFEFVQAIIEEGGYEALDRVYQDPPSSTAEILHPQKYMRGKVKMRQYSDKEVMACAPQIEGGIQYRETVGKYPLAAVLAAQLKDEKQSLKAVEGWLGDKLLMFGDSPVYSAITWRIGWESERDADKFARVYLETLKKRFPDGNSDRGKKTAVKSSGKYVFSVSVLEKETCLVIDFVEASNSGLKNIPPTAGAEN